MPAQFGLLTVTSKMLNKCDVDLSFNKNTFVTSLQSFPVDCETTLQSERLSDHWR